MSTCWLDSFLACARRRRCIRYRQRAIEKPAQLAIGPFSAYLDFGAFTKQQMEASRTFVLCQSPTLHLCNEWAFSASVSSLTLRAGALAATALAVATR